MHPGLATPAQDNLPLRAAADFGSIGFGSVVAGDGEGGATVAPATLQPAQWRFELENSATAQPRDSPHLSGRGAGRLGATVISGSAFGDAATPTPSAFETQTLHRARTCAARRPRPLPASMAEDGQERRLVRPEARCSGHLPKCRSHRAIWSGSRQVASPIVVAMPALGNPRARLLELIVAFRQTQCARVAVEIGVADQPASGPASSADLAVACRAKEPFLRRLLRVLTALGLQNGQLPAAGRATMLRYVETVPGTGCTRARADRAGGAGRSGPGVGRRSPGGRG